ncbi:GNAT family N-acetyltransferase [Brevibacillus porteri]|uniref:GNAT family N-acetyltransferase n=1 Tax=Brevibacillus porteri TaxID=2126350 RepID=A0ABX5FJN6_9BACL|nr:GNAT family N-acetyltransferase [Brevibacillus porteri]MED1800815.1 GNAT family N-acetyltransferase [Brevibacillus porteri]MED2132585.1 GNAT family N-acetyltransferase [Brevibacillus porteri]MED2747679.1 GNAT family N-acetyltransferase [Brevibacillus porteri]MED2818235.1 GNAT family N-acetyltransferase [Brevibacillus porteri]MED2894689.1 GNAT family N-acetyltransferase [Brevibacillus porteri]
MSFIIRSAAADDVNSLTELMHEYVVGFYQNPWPGTEKIHNLIQTLLEKQQGVQFVVEQEGKLIGFATLYFTISTMKADKITLMNDLFVLEQYRDTEVESQLFLECQRYTQKQGFAHMTWITSIQNNRAQLFFEKMGGVRGNWVNYSII